MTLDFGDLDQLLEWSGVKFTAGGKEYRIEPPTAAVGLWVERIAAEMGPLRAATTDEEIAAAAARIEKVPGLDGDDVSLPQRLLCATYDELVADGVDYIRIRHLTAAVFTWIAAGDEAAIAYMRSGGRPEANRAQRRAASKRSSGTAAASGTRSAARTSGTTSRRTTPPAAAKSSRGRKS